MTGEEGEIEHDSTANEKRSGNLWTNEGACVSINFKRGHQ
jgi:hypothetical protein